MDGKQNAQARHCAVENNNAEFQIPARFDQNRNVLAEDSTKNYTQGDVQSSLPTLDLPNSGNFSETREESQLVDSVCTVDTTNDYTGTMCK